jgi:hypothetical protein
VTRTEKDKNNPAVPPKASVEKQRVADMNIFSPRRDFDFRISISIETPGKKYIFWSQPVKADWPDSAASEFTSNRRASKEQGLVPASSFSGRLDASESCGFGRFGLMFVYRIILIFCGAAVTESNVT